MATNIAKLNVQITGNGKALRVDLTQNLKAFDRFSKGMRRRSSILQSAIGSTLGNVAANFATRGIDAIGRGVRELGRRSLDFSNEFQKSIAIQTQLTEEFSQRMRDEAQKTAREVRFGAEEIAAGYFFLASAGQTAEQQLESIGFVSRFAQAGTFDLARATDLLTDAQSALGLVRADPAENLRQLERVGDVLIKANTLSNATAEQFSEGVTSGFGASLRVARKSLEEGVAVLTVFADQGIKGAEASTLASIALRELSIKAIRNKKAFEEAGVAVFDAEGNFKSFAEIVGDLERAFDGLSSREVRSQLLDLGFNIKSVKAIELLIGSSEQLATRFEQLQTSAAGFTEIVADRQFTPFTRSVTELDGALDNMAETFQNAQNAVVPVILVMTEAVDKLTEQLVAFDNFLGGRFGAANAFSDFATEFEKNIPKPATNTPSDVGPPEQLTGLAKLRANYTKDELDAMERQAKLLKDDLLTPLERFNVEFDELDQLRDLEFINADFFDRAAEQLKKEFVDSSVALADIQPEVDIPSFASATARGSQNELESRLRTLDLIRKATQVKPEDKLRNDLLAQINRAIRDFLARGSEAAEPPIEIGVASIP